MMAADTDDMAREERLQRLIARLPRRLQHATIWLRTPGRRVPAGPLPMVGACLAILPILKLWMLPLGIVLLAEDVSPLLGSRREADRADPRSWLEASQQPASS